MQLTSVACLCSLWMAFLVYSPSQANVLWTENAESGLTYVIDGTHASYPLIQSDIVGEGNYAFRLAHPNFTPGWFEIDQTITLESQTQLFFLSRLGWATPDQVATVQLSTDGGTTWPIDLFSQAGTGNSGEGGFGLRQINLSPYSGQDVRFRFNYQFSSGSAFTQIDPGVGWYVDDIQIADQYQKQQYSIGNPSAHEQLYLEYINRARADALAEAQRLAAETDPDIVSAYNFFGISPQNIIYQFEQSVANSYFDQHAQPLAFNASLVAAAQLHTQDMFDNEFQGHTSSSNPPVPFQPGFNAFDRANALGYVGGVGENVYAFADSVAEGHAAFDVDWGAESPGHPEYNPDFAGQGMQNPAGHRRNIHDDIFKEIGVGVINDSKGSVGPQLVTQNFGVPGNVTYITGVVYEDLNDNQFYDLDEGRAGVRIDVDGSGFFAISSDSGGYAIPVSGDGQYEVTFSGGGYSTFVTQVDIVNGNNVKVDYLVSAPLLAGDFNGDGVVDADDLVVWQSGFGTQFDGDDFLIWQREFGSGFTPSAAAVPEPNALALLFLGGLFLLRHPLLPRATLPLTRGS